MIKKGEKNKIDILIPSGLIEENISSFKKELSDLNLEDQLNKSGSNKFLIIFDLSKITEIDFFGYQHLYAFYLYLKKKSNVTNIVINNESEVFMNFIKKLGLSFNE